MNDSEKYDDEAMALPSHKAVFNADNYEHYVFDLITGRKRPNCRK